MKFKKAFNHKVTIKPSNNAGYIVNIGCATLIFTTPHSVAEFLKEYFTDSEKMEKEYNSCLGADLAEVATDSESLGKEEGGEAA